jgi:hypothetical protein
MVKLTPEEQQNYLRAAAEVFTPAAGAWGVQGATMVRLKTAKKALTKKALETAWRETYEKSTRGSLTQRRRGAEKRE